MRAVDVGVGHDDDLVIAQLVDVELIPADAGAERHDQRADFLRRQHLVETRALHVQDLAAQGQDRLGAAVAALLGGAASGVTLDQEQFGLRRVLFLTVGQLARQAVMSSAVLRRVSSRALRAASRAAPPQRSC